MLPLIPKRADLGALRVVSSMGKLASDENGIIVPASGECKLVLNAYKTCETYGQYIETLPTGLAKIVRASLAAYPRTYLFSGPRDKPLSDTSYGVRVASTMDKYMDKALGINDLRHMYISQKIDLSKVTHEQRGVIAQSMMHSPEVQLEYIRVL